jgi:hypothetical protein
VRFFAFAAVCALSSCSLFVGLDGLNDGGVASDSGEADVFTPTDSAIADAQSGTDAPLGSDGAITPNLCPPGSIFCDDFETGDFSKWDNVSSATLPSLFEVTTAKAWRGTHAMHVSVVDSSDAGNVYNFFVLKSFPAVSSGTIAFRAYVFASTTPTYGGLLVLGHGITPAQTLVLGAANGAGCPVGTTDCVGNALVGGNDFTDVSAVSFPSGRWVCLEWIAVIGTTGSVIAYTDGSPIVQSMHDTSDPGGGYTSLSVGLVGATGGQELYYDDVAIAAERIGCE